MALLILSMISKSYKKNIALPPVSLQIHEKERLVVTGPSGSGKSTLLRLVAGLEPPDSGEIVLRGEVVSRAGEVVVPPEERNMGMVFQDLALWPHMTVFENVAFGPSVRGMAREAVHDLVMEMLERVGIGALSDRRPDELSGGQRQRVALARALVTQPAVLLMDEPFSSLDRDTRTTMMELVLSLHEIQGFALIHVTHDPGEAEVMGERVVDIRDLREAGQGS